MGRIGQAIEQTQRAYPGLLDSNQNLMFMLKCRQFVEMVNGSDFYVRLELVNKNEINLHSF
jgi:Ran-binding protein 9/10